LSYAGLENGIPKSNFWRFLELSKHKQFIMHVSDARAYDKTHYKNQRKDARQ